jgi:hypothetical protein
MHTTAAKIFASYEAAADDGHRPHLGASQIGHRCERYLWLTFRWARKANFSGRMLRLFATGQLEEARIVADLRAIGVQVYDLDSDGKQWRVNDIGGHFGGSMDAAVIGLPEAPKTWHVAEFKTHNRKSFEDLAKRRVQAAKPQHYAQMQVYMGLTHMDRAVYVAVNKDNDELYIERVEFDPAEFTRLTERAERVIGAAEPPLRISADPSWWECKMCDYAALCHGTALPEVNCRTCAHSTPETDGDARWTCARDKTDLPLHKQHAGCGQHRYIPIMLEKVAEQIDVVDDEVVYRVLEGGATFRNGNGPGSLTSLELAALETPRMAPDAGYLKMTLHSTGIESRVVA